MQRGFPHCVTLLFLLVTPATLFADEADGFVSVPERGEVGTADRSVTELTIPEPFRLPAESFRFESRLMRTTLPVRVHRVQFPSPLVTADIANNTVHAEYFLPEGPGPFPGCVVLHILGGEFQLSRLIADSLARAGVAALFIKMPYYGERRGTSGRRMIDRDPRQTVAGMTQAVLDIRRAGEWLMARPEVEVERLGVTGISLGGIMAGLSGSIEPRFRRVAIYLGGGELASNLWRMEDSGAAEFRREWLSRGGTRESFIAALSPVEPVKYAPRLRDRTVLMVAARQDEIIPPASARALWTAIGSKPEIVWLDAGHYTAAMYLPRELQRLQRFFSAPRDTVKPTQPEPE